MGWMDDLDSYEDSIVEPRPAGPWRRLSNDEVRSLHEDYWNDLFCLSEYFHPICVCVIEDKKITAMRGKADFPPPEVTKEHNVRGVVILTAFRSEHAVDLVRREQFQKGNTFITWYRRDAARDEYGRVADLETIWRD